MSFAVGASCHVHQLIKGAQAFAMLYKRSSAREFNAHFLGSYFHNSQFKLARAFWKITTLTMKVHTSRRGHASIKLCSINWLLVEQIRLHPSETICKKWRLRGHQVELQHVVFILKIPSITALHVSNFLFIKSANSVRNVALHIA